MYPTRQTFDIMQSTSASGCNITTNRKYLAHVHRPIPTSSALPIPPKRTLHVTNSFHFVGTLISPTWIPTFMGPSILLPFMVAKVVTALISRIGGSSNPAPICFIIWFLQLRFWPTWCMLTHALILHFTTLLYHTKSLHISMIIQCQNTGSYILNKRSSIYLQPLPFSFWFFLGTPRGLRVCFPTCSYHSFWSPFLVLHRQWSYFMQRSNFHGPSPLNTPSIMCLDELVKYLWVA